MEKTGEVTSKQPKRIISSILQEINMLDSLTEQSSADAMIKYIIKSKEEEEFL